MLCVVLAIPIVIAGLFFGRDWVRRTRRAKILAQQLTASERQIVERLVPITRRLPAHLWPALEGKINLFLDQITFHGNDIEVTEEMKLAIASQAALLVVNSPSWYETLRTVLIYPTAFRSRHARRDGYVVSNKENIVLGESWARGPVVLSWAHSLQGGLNEDDGHNVVIHEFAHQLDDLTGHTNGIPVLRKSQDYSGWETAMLEAYDTHVDRVDRGRRTLIDPYGATGHEEFFAEGIVTFFEKPDALREEEPALYAQFSELLGLDPASWR